jgi:hypothetical protein
LRRFIVASPINVGRSLTPKERILESIDVMLAHVRFGSKADMCSAKGDVRFTPNSDRESGFPHKVMSALPPKRPV